MKRILITGGAGFIGSHVARELVTAGYEVRALDNLCEQVHAPRARRPAYLDPEVELMVGDVRDPHAVSRALDGVDAVFHFAARVGVGQSMYEIAEYTSVNNVGTAVLLEAVIARKKSLGRLIVASSMSIYGEGLYRDAGGMTTTARERTLDQLQRGRWEVIGARGDELIPVPTTEVKLPSLPSMYALQKYDQERMCLIAGRAYGFDAVALRFFNAYGAHQALSNPYTGVLAIFGARLLNDRPPLLYEDGRQLRDFVDIRDVARSCRLALETPAAAGRVFNIGSGRHISVSDVARRMAEAVGKPHVAPEITGKYRQGDIRHCFPDIAEARRVLGYEPAIPLEDGLRDLAAWLATQTAVDRVESARAELDERGLTI
jgi:dTDP-L-rhamnose 4-epimerase